MRGCHGSQSISQGDRQARKEVRRQRRALRHAVMKMGTEAGSRCFGLRPGAASRETNIRGFKAECAVSLSFERDWRIPP